MNKNKAKGTKGETEVVKYLNSCGLHAQRRALHGNKDQGDIEVIYNTLKFIIEVKSGKQTYNPNRAQFKDWYWQTHIEERNSGLPAVLVINRYNRKIADSDVYFNHDGFVCHMYLDEFAEFILYEGEDWFPDKA